MKIHIHYNGTIYTFKDFEEVQIFINENPINAIDEAELWITEKIEGGIHNEHRIVFRIKIYDI